MRNAGIACDLSLHLISTLAIKAVLQLHMQSHTDKSLQQLAPMGVFFFRFLFISTSLVRSVQIFPAWLCIEAGLKRCVLQSPRCCQLENK